MNKRPFVSFAILLSYILFTQVAAAQVKPITVGLIGDSTVANTYGWGPALAAKINEQAKVLNYAENGATLESLQGKLSDLIAQKPNYILVQFGHNDMLRYDAEAYGQRLRSYIDRIKASGITAIVLSPVSRREFDETGRIRPRVIDGDRSLPIFSRSAQAVAKETSSLFVDLNTISMEHHNRIGEEASAAYNFQQYDVTHFSDAGANAIASLIIDELKNSAPDLAAYFH